MIEAVNSVLQTAPFVRATNEQISTVDSFAANPDRVQKAPQAPYISPYIFLDVNFDKAVIQLRNGETGDVENQYPSEATLQAQARSDARRQIERDAQLSTGPETQQQASPPVSQTVTAQQQAAFQAAAQTGNSNAGNITLFA
jgi:hypothetical protein